MEGTATAIPEVNPEVNRVEQETNRKRVIGSARRIMRKSNMRIVTHRWNGEYRYSIQAASTIRTCMTMAELSAFCREVRLEQ